MKHFYSLLGLFICLVSMAQNPIIPFKVDSVSETGKVSFSGKPDYYRVLLQCKTGVFGETELRILMRTNFADSKGGKIDFYDDRSLDYVFDKSESVLLAFIECEGKLYLMPQESNRVLQKHERRWVTAPNQNLPLAEIKESDGQLLLSSNVGEIPCYLAPDFSPTDVDAINNAIPAICTLMNDEFNSKARSNDYYKFDQYGKLDEFRYTYNDGVVLEYKASPIEHKRNNSQILARQGSNIVKGHQSGFTTYCSEDGSRISVDKAYDADSYEQLISGVSGFPGVDYDEVLEITFPNGVSFKRWEQKDGYIGLTEWKGKDLAGNEFVDEFYYGDWSFSDNASLESKQRVYNKLSTQFKKLYFKDYVYECINIEKGISRIYYPDGSFFEGSVVFDTIDNGNTPPELCSPDVINWMIRLFGMNQQRDKVYKPYTTIYDVKPSAGQCYDAKGSLNRIVESPTEWFDVAGDGTVTEVYQNGKPLPPGFGRDRKLNEYNGKLKEERDRLKAQEEYAKKVAAEQEAEKRKTEEWEQSVRAKYGSAFDTLKSGRIPLGVDMGIFDYFRCYVQLRYDGKNSKKYDVTVFTVAGGVREMTVWTNNGKISSVFYYD